MTQSERIQVINGPDGSQVISPNGRHADQLNSHLCQLCGNSTFTLTNTPHSSIFYLPHHLPAPEIADALSLKFGPVDYYQTHGNSRNKVTYYPDEDSCVIGILAERFAKQSTFSQISTARNYASSPVPISRKTEAELT